MIEIPLAAQLLFGALALVDIVAENQDPVFAGNFGGYGNMVIVDHRGGFFTVYGKLDEITVQKNQSVKGFEVIGKVEQEEGVLYFELRKKDAPQNPIAWLKKNQ